MYKVGLTGNYYSGHKEVAYILEDFGVPVFDMNLVFKFLVNFSPTHIEKIKKSFGNNIYTMGLLDLQKFTKNSDFDKLFDVIEFDLIRGFEKFTLANKDAVYSVMVFDQLFERKCDRLMSFCISVHRPKHLRKNDMITLTGLDSYTITKILDNEYDELDKNKKSDFVIQNYNLGVNKDSDITIGLENQVKNAHKKIMEKKLYSIVQSQYGI